MFLGIKERFEEVFDNMLYSVATLVDPLTKKFFTLLPEKVQAQVAQWLQSQIAEVKTIRFFLQKQEEEVTAETDGATTTVL